MHKMFEYSYKHILLRLEQKPICRGSRLELLSAFLIVHSIFNCKHFQALYIRNITHSSIYIHMFNYFHYYIMKLPNVTLAFIGRPPPYLLTIHICEWMKWNYSCIMLRYVYFSNASRGIPDTYLNLKHRYTERIL